MSYSEAEFILENKNPKDETVGFRHTVIYSYITSYSKTKIISFHSIDQKEAARMLKTKMSNGLSNFTTTKGMKRCCSEHYHPSSSKKPKNVISEYSTPFFPYRPILQI